MLPLERQLRVGGQPVALGARAFDLLIELTRQPGQLRTRAELLEAVWAGSVVEDHNLPVQIATLRKVLGPGAIATIPGYGYRFTAPLVPPPAQTGTPADAAASRVTPTRPPARPATSRLPPAWQPLIGREAELSTLLTLAKEHSLVSVIGPGGIGKTRLAQALAAAQGQAYPHGTAWVDLSPLRDGKALAPTIAAALGLNPGAGDPLQGLCDLVAPLDLLLVLDNAEHLIDAVARVAQALLDAAPGLRLLVTSQLPVKLPAEQVHRLGALAVPEEALPAKQALTYGAVALFVERARQLNHRFALTDRDAGPVIALCRQLDGLPLAIELAAARAGLLGVQALAASLDDRLRLLTHSRDRSAPERQQTLRAALEWSHGLLPEAEAVVFRRLAVVAGSASLETLQRVLADEEAHPGRDIEAEGPAPGAAALDRWTLLDALMSLVERSLVAVVEAPAGADADPPPAPRYRLLESPRALALERLRAVGEEARMRRRHAAALAELFDEAWARSLQAGTRLDAWAQALQRDLDNARAALGWALSDGNTTLALRLASSMLRAMPDAAQAERLEICALCDRLAQTERRADLRVRAAVATTPFTYIHDGPRALRTAQRAVADCDAIADAGLAQRLRYLALASVVVAASRLRALDVADQAFHQARALESAATPAQMRRFLAFGGTTLENARGDPQACLHQALQLVALLRASGGSALRAMSDLISAQLSAADPEAAVQTGEALLHQLQGSRDEWALAFARLNTAAAWLAVDRPDRARPLLEAGWPNALRFSLEPYYADYLALLAALEHRPHAAALLLGYAQRRNEAAGPREPNEIAAVQRAEQAVAAALPPERTTRLREQGQRADDGEIGSIAFAAIDAG